MKGEVYSPCNMFISTKEVFDNYSEWLFNVLDGYDAELEKMGIERMARVDGFLAECLLNIYFLHNYDEKEIYRLDFVNIETEPDYRYPSLIRSNENVLRMYNNFRSNVKLLMNAGKYRKHKDKMKQ